MVMMRMKFLASSPAFTIPNSSADKPSTNCQTSPCAGLNMRLNVDTLALLSGDDSVLKVGVRRHAS
jgi:hypothetical protein